MPHLPTGCCPLPLEKTRGVERGPCQGSGPGLPGNQPRSKESPALGPQEGAWRRTNRCKSGTCRRLFDGLPWFQISLNKERASRGACSSVKWPRIHQKKEGVEGEMGAKDTAPQPGGHLERVPWPGCCPCQRGGGGRGEGEEFSKCLSTRCLIDAPFGKGRRVRG